LHFDASLKQSVALGPEDLVKPDWDQGWCRVKPQTAVGYLFKIRIATLKIRTVATARVAVFALGYELCSAQSTAVLGLSRH
jgi:hypothetical protein